MGSFLLTTYAFCEPAGAGSHPYWHIRPLGVAGRKESGGADTPALCGVVVSWDLGGPVDLLSVRYELEHGCRPCAEKWLLAVGKDGEA